MKKKQNLLTASQVKSIKKIKESVLYASGDAVLGAKSSESSEIEGKLRTFSGTSYTGGIMIPSWGVPVVIDISGMSVPKSQRPQLKDHDTSKVVGHADKFSLGDTIEIGGVMSGANEATKEVISASDNGFIWQQSVGIEAEQVRIIKKDETVKVNGRVFKGQEFYLIEKSVLKENSFVALGADDSTSSLVASEYKNNFLRNTTMNFSEWLNAKGFDEADLSETAKTSLQAMFDAEGSVEASATKEVKATKDKEIVQAKLPEVDLYAQASKQAEHIAKISELTKEHPSIQASAIAGKWDETKIELEILKATRANVPNIIIDNGIEANDFDKVLECAVSVSANNKVSEKDYSEKVQAQADKHFRNIGLQEMLVEGAKKNGYMGASSFGRNPKEIMKSAFSTISLPTMLSNIMNKQIRVGFDSVDQAWREIASIGSTRDFKKLTRISLTGDNVFEKLAPDGEIVHGKVGEETYENQIDTYAKMISITRKMIIDDDLSGLSTVPLRLGRGGALKVNDVFYTVFLNNATQPFPVADTNNNYLAGAGSALTIAGLSSAVTKLLKQTDPDGQPMSLAPKIIFAPSELDVEGGKLVRDVTLVSGEVITQTNQNPHAGKYKLVTSPYLSNTNYTGNSATAWYLLTEPIAMPLIEMLFLNGKQTPTIESADADFDVLGIQMRGYFDFGCAFQEPRAGLKSAGV